MTAAPDSQYALPKTHKGFLQRIVSRTALAAFAFTCLYSGAASAANCSIETSPSPAVISEGQSVDFSGNVSGKTPKTYSWTFDGGTPVSSSQSSVTVTYASPGSYTATLDGTDGKGKTCTASVTVTVNAGGGNQDPVCTIDSPATDVTITEGDSVNYAGTATDADGTIASYAWSFPGGTPSSSSAEDPGNVTYNTAGTYVTSFSATDNESASCAADTRTITVEQVGGGDTPTARGDAYATPIGKTLSVTASAVSGVLYNDF
jgi:PKD repeat protein